MTITLNGTTGITTPTYGGTNTAEYQVPVTAFKNRIINGAMMIDQRNAGASVTPTNTGALTYTLDRWAAYGSQASKFSVQQSTTVPAGYKNSIVATSLSSYTVGSGEIFKLTQLIEGSNCADLGFGSANAATVTLSFWVRSSLTGTFGGALSNDGLDRSYPFSYTISAANTWEQKSVTITGDTSGTWLTSTGTGIQVIWSLGAGSSRSNTAGAWAAGNYQSATGATSVVGTSGATFYITGVQLEKGSTATSFDYRPYGSELVLCQRYYEQSAQSQDFIWAGQCTTGNQYYLSIPFQVEKRTAPTVTVTDGGKSAFDGAAAGTTYVKNFQSYSNCTSTSTRGYWYTNYKATAEL